MLLRREGSRFRGGIGDVRRVWSVQGGIGAALWAILAACSGLKIAGLEIPRQ